jgi:toxin ParE1/3/4
MQMDNYKLSPLAESDLHKIITSTINKWGVEQAKVYAESLESALIKLAQYPDFGRQREELYPNARSFPIEMHIVFYSVCNEGIEIARILHQRMDSSKHF